MDPSNLSRTHRTNRRGTGGRRGGMGGYRYGGSWPGRSATRTGARSAGTAVGVRRVAGRAPCSDALWRGSIIRCRTAVRRRHIMRAVVAIDGTYATSARSFRAIHRRAWTTLSNTPMYGRWSSRRVPTTDGSRIYLRRSCRKHGWAAVTPSIVRMSCRMISPTAPPSGALTSAMSM